MLQISSPDRNYCVFDHQNQRQGQTDEGYRDGGAATGIQLDQFQDRWPASFAAVTDICKRWWKSIRRRIPEPPQSLFRPRRPPRTRHLRESVARLERIVMTHVGEVPAASEKFLVEAV